jgi:type IV pilus assembly protein PilA
MNAWPPDQSASGCSTQSTKYVTALVVGANGIITVTAASAAVGTSGDFVLAPTVVASGQIDWTCTGSSISAKYLPANCR